MKHVEKSRLKQELALEPFFTELQIEIDSSNERLFSSCERKRLKITNIRTGKAIGCIEAPTSDIDGEEILSFTVSPRTDDVAIAYSSGIIRHFKTDSDPVKLVRTWKSQHIGPIVRMVFDPIEGQLLATGGCDSTIKIWDTVQRFCTHNLKGAIGVISAMAFQPAPTEGRYELLATGDQEHRLIVWNLINSKQVTKLEGHAATVTAIRYFPNDPEFSRAISASRDKMVIIWDLKNHAALKKYPVFEAIEGLVFVSWELTSKLIQGNNNSKKNRNDSIFATAGERGTIKLWSSESGNLLFEQKNALLERKDDSGVPAVTQLILGSSSNELALTTPENNVLFYSFEPHQLFLTRQLAGHVDEVLCVKFLGPEQQHLVVCTNSPIIKIFNITTLSCSIIEGHEDIVLNVAVFPADRNLFATTSKDNCIRIWKFYPATMKAKCLFRGAGHSHSVTALALPARTTRFAVTGSEDTTLKIWKIPNIEDDKLENHKEPQNLNTLFATKAHEKDINSICIAPNDKLICSASQDKTAKLWTLDIGGKTSTSSAGLELDGTLRGHRRGIWCASFSSVDQVVATGSADATIKIWAIVDFSCLKTLQGHDCSVLSLMFCTRGMQVVSVASDGNLKLWSVKSGECVATVDAHSDKTWSMDVNSSEELFVTGAADSRIVIWKDTTELEIETEAKQHDVQIEATQSLMNLMQRRNWSKALKVAIRLEQPHRSMNILKEMLIEEKSHDMVITRIMNLRHDQLITLLKMAVEWNKNSRHSLAAQIVLKAVLTKMSPEEILEISDSKTLLASLIPYCERHLARADRLLQQATFLDFMWSSMKLKELSM